MDYNKSLVAGRIANDPKFFPHKSDASKNKLVFVVAVNNFRSETANFIPVALWGKLADAGLDYLNKGKEVFVEGRISATYNKELEKSFFEVTASTITYGRDSKKVQNERIAQKESSSASSVDALADQLMSRAGSKSENNERSKLKTALMTRGLSASEAEAILKEHYKRNQPEETTVCADEAVDIPF